MKKYMSIEERVAFLQNVLLRKVLNDEGRKKFYDGILWSIYFERSRLTHDFIDRLEARIARIAKDKEYRINA